MRTFLSPLLVLLSAIFLTAQPAAGLATGHSLNTRTSSPHALFHLSNFLSASITVPSHNSSGSEADVQTHAVTFSIADINSNGTAAGELQETCLMTWTSPALPPTASWTQCSPGPSTAMGISSLYYARIVKGSYRSAGEFELRVRQLYLSSSGAIVKRREAEARFCAYQDPPEGEPQGYSCTQSGGDGGVEMVFCGISQGLDVGKA